MAKSSIKELLLLHQTALDIYVNQITQYPLSDDLKENVLKIKTAKELFEKELNKFPNKIDLLELNDIRILCHDLRNPINGMLGFSEMCLESIEESEWLTLKTLFQSIIEINHKLLNLINTIHPTKNQEQLIPEIISDEISEKLNGTILIVEDNQTNRELLFNWLNAKGFRVYQASNGDEALMLVAKHSDIDVILLDILMVGKDGFAVLKEVRQSKANSEIAIIMLTALDDVNNVVKCIKMGAEDYLTKPFNSFLLEAKIKSNIEKKRLRYENLHHAREAGMADVATHVLHNVGNFLNSVNVASTLLTEKIRKSDLAALHTLKNLINENEKELSKFLTSDTEGKKIPKYICALSDYWQEEQTVLLNHLKVMNEKIQHIKEIVNMQQSLSHSTGVDERINVEETIETSLSLQQELLSQNKIEIERHYAEIDPIFLDKIKLIQIIANLISNANDALHESSNSVKRITIHLKPLSDNKILIQIQDNGHGISEENLKKIFFQGFTTKKTGHGFGLHGSVLAAQEMGGSLTAESEGIGKGASFNLILPMKVNYG